MIETYLVALIFAKIKGYRISLIFKSWTIYPIFLFECIYIFFQINTFAGNYEYIMFATIFKKLYLYLFMIPMIKYRLYFSGLIGAIFVLLGTCLNNVVIYANGGRMPVFPSMSYVTGYITPGIFEQINDIHVLGTVETNLKFLTDIIDLGYCVLSIGDVFIRIFVLIIIYFTIKELNK